MCSASSAGRVGTVRWLEAGQGRRRRRRRRPVRIVPILVLLAIIAVGVGAFVLVRGREHRADRERAAVARFAVAWARGDTRAMWQQLSAGARHAYPLRVFRASYRAADGAATVRAVRPGAAAGPRDGAVRLPVTVQTRVFGRLRGTLVVPVRTENGEGRI